MKESIIELGKFLQEPTFHSSYRREDCIFLLKDISAEVMELTISEKEALINSGVSYSEMLPKEELPAKEYIDIFFNGLERKKQHVAEMVECLAENLYSLKGDDLVLVSLARAGTPIGILIKRYLKLKYSIDIPHYSISIIRGKGFDFNALAYILSRHNNCKVQFVDGWTGKGAIGDELKKSCESFKDRFGVQLDDSLAVLADPAGSAEIYATRDDIFLPHCCLNSTVSGLVSRTFDKPEVIGKYDFHGAKYYSEWISEDYSNMFIRKVTECFNPLPFGNLVEETEPVDYRGESNVEKIKILLEVADRNKIKPSIGETTRVLLRRVPRCIVIKDSNSPDIAHIIHLATEKNVEIRLNPDMDYEAIGIIK